jgi:threonylcarbamoyladenosine tRNA methylthiotransferase MtaB
MRELSRQKRNDFYAGFVGQRVSVLVETKVDKTSGLNRGFSRNYLPVAVAAAGDLANHEIEVRISDIRNGWLAGEASIPESVGLKPAPTSGFRVAQD